MTRSYTLHLSRDALPGDARALERAELVRDGFSWGAFLFTALWFFWHRLWLVGIGLLVAEFAFGWGLNRLGVHPGAAMAATLLLNLLIGLEAASLRRWWLARRGRPAVDVVSAADLEEAEVKSFARFLAAETIEPGEVQATRQTAAPGRAHPVIGLFPDAERAW